MALAAVACFVAAPARAEAPSAFDGEAPRFETRDLDGNRLQLDALLARGPVLLDFWATWCRPCLRAIPELQALSDTYGERGLTVIGISTDGPRNFPKVRPFARRLEIEYPIVLDEDGTLQQRYQARALPTTVLIGPDGKIVRVLQGYRPGEIEALGETIESLLVEAADDHDEAGDGR